jgi:hypothetical protein
MHFLRNARETYVLFAEPLAQRQVRPWLRIPCAPLRRFLAQEKFVAPKRAANTARRVRYPTLRPAARIVVSDFEDTVVSTKPQPASHHESPRRSRRSG